MIQKIKNLFNRKKDSVSNEYMAKMQTINGQNNKLMNHFIKEDEAFLKKYNI